MKKITSFMLILSIILSMALILSSCGEETGSDGGVINKDGTISYDLYGLKFRLPDYFRKKHYNDYYEIQYATPGATFLVQVLSKEEIEDKTMEYEFDFDITVKEYIQFLIDLNGYQCEYTYDEERDVANFYLFYSYDDIEYDYEYYTILKNEHAIYIVLMYCAEADYENYEPLFRLWSSYITAN